MKLQLKKFIRIAVFFLAGLIIAFGVVCVGISSENDFREEKNTLSGKIVFLDAGHGNGSGGEWKSYKEHKHMLRYAKMVKEKLENCGAVVVMTRTSNEDINNYARIAMVNAYSVRILLNAVEADAESMSNELMAAKEAGSMDLAERITEELNVKRTTAAELEGLIDYMCSIIENPTLANKYFLSPYSAANGRPVSPELERIFEYQKNDALNNVIYVSLHSNATSDGSLETNGTATYYMDNNANTAYYQGYQQEKNALLASCLLDSVSAAGDFSQWGPLVNDFYMVRETNIPAVLVEIAFHTNDSDRAKLISPVYRQRITNGIVYGIAEYFNIEQ